MADKKTKKPDTGIGEVLRNAFANAAEQVLLDHQWFSSAPFRFVFDDGIERGTLHIFQEGQTVVVEGELFDKSGEYGSFDPRPVRAVIDTREFKPVKR